MIVRTKGQKHDLVGAIPIFSCTLSQGPKRCCCWPLTVHWSFYREMLGEKWHNNLFLLRILRYYQSAAVLKQLRPAQGKILICLLLNLVTNFCLWGYKHCHYFLELHSTFLQRYQIDTARDFFTIQIVLLIMKGLVHTTPSPSQTLLPHCGIEYLCDFVIEYKI